MIRRFLIDNEYQVVYVFDEDKKENRIIIADLAIKINDDKLKQKSGYIEYGIDTKYGKIVKIEICKTSFAAFVCSVIFVPKNEITDEREIYDIYNDLKSVLTNVA